MMGKKKSPQVQPQVQPQVEEYLLEMYKALKRVKHLRGDGDDIARMAAAKSPANARQLELEILQAQMWAQALTAQIQFLGGSILE